ncbi:chromatin-binding protein CTF4 [Sporobolomyces salmoneus]|uniref:chromatin-binding protein CTF4 n=1 Tax=Sporobolomyces salmoneus TaxID=183962 RepID=UPI00316E33E4
MAADANKFVVTPHADGLSRLTFSPNGHYLYTAGSEGFMRVFDARTSAPKDIDPLLCDYHEDPVLSLSASNDYWCSASESGQVVLFKAGSKDVEDDFKLVTRFSFPARSVRFDPKTYKRVACTSDDVIVKIVNIEDTDKVQILAGHKQPVREASWSPDGNYLTTSSTDGQIRVWKLDSGTEPTCLQVLDGLIKAEDADSEYSVEAVWHPSGKFFAIAAKDDGVSIISSESWKKVGSFSGHSGPVSSLAFSANGRYLVSAGKDEKVLVWDVQDLNKENKSPVTKTTHDHGLVTSIAFHPAAGSNALAWMDNKGQLTRWNDPIPDGKPPPSDVIGAKRGNDSTNGTGGGRRRSDSASTSTSSRAGGNRGGGGGDLFRKPNDDEDEDEFDRFNAGGNGFDDWIDDDTNEFGVAERKSEEQEARRFRMPSEFESGGSFGSKGKRKADPFASSSSLVPKGQAPFQPGSTPIRENKRYLAFNMVGYIHIVEREDYNLVTVDFHDRSSHVSIRFDDSIKYNLAALGEMGAVFAAPGLGSSEPSKILYKPYESWTTLSDWEASLPIGENATLVAVGGIAPVYQGEDEATSGLTGSGAVLVATDRCFVRFFTGAGLQKYVWNIGEEIVAMSGGKDWAMIVHRANGVGAGLEFALIDTDSFEVVQAGKVPLAKGVTLKWIGFNDENIPVMYDSNGLFSVLDRSRRPRQGRWLPALDTRTLARREGKQEDYWPVGLDSNVAHVIILKGEEKYPHFPTPLMQELDLQFPLLNLDITQGQLEEKHLRESIFVTHRRDGAPADDYVSKSALAREELQVDKHLLQLISTYCKAERLEAALDAVLLLTQPASLTAAMKISDFFLLPALSERIDIVRAAKTGEDPDDAASKRQSKYAHLNDERTIPEPRSRSNGVNGRSSRGGGGDDFFSPRPSGMSSVFGSGRKSSTPLASSSSSKRRKSMPAPSNLGVDSGFGSDEVEPEGESMDVDLNGDFDEAQDAQDEPSPKRFRTESPAAMDEEEEEEVSNAPPPKKAVNPFAKRAPAAKSSAPAANPFAGKKGGNSKEVKRTDSFFNRVEGTAPAKTKVKGVRTTNGPASAKKPQTTVPGSKQTTLFGVAPGIPKPTEKKGGRKRKAAEGEEEQTPATTSTSSKKLDAFVKKPGSSQAAGLGAEAARELPRDGEEMEETQIEETQVEETQPRTESRLDLVAEEAEEEEEILEDTQVVETQEEVSPPVPQTTASKLAQFAFKKPDAPVAPASPSNETPTENEAPEPVQSEA